MPTISLSWMWPATSLSLLSSHHDCLLSAGVTLCSPHTGAASWHLIDDCSFAANLWSVCHQTRSWANQWVSWVHSRFAIDLGDKSCCQTGFELWLLGYHPKSSLCYCHCYCCHCWLRSTGYFATAGWWCQRYLLVVGTFALRSSYLRYLGYQVQCQQPVRRAEHRADKQASSITCFSFAVNYTN